MTTIQLIIFIIIPIIASKANYLGTSPTAIPVIVLTISATTAIIIKYYDNLRYFAILIF